MNRSLRRGKRLNQSWPGSACAVREASWRCAVRPGLSEGDRVTAKASAPLSGGLAVGSARLASGLVPDPDAHQGNREWLADAAG